MLRGLCWTGGLEVGLDRLDGGRSTFLRLADVRRICWNEAKADGFEREMGSHLGEEFNAGQIEWSKLRAMKELHLGGDRGFCPCDLID